MNQIDIRPIDANALMRKACEMFYTTDYYNHISKMIEDAQTITLKPQRTGHWIPHLQDARGYADEFECSACKRFVHFPYPTRICDYEYCPYCNAKMED